MPWPHSPSAKCAASAWSTTASSCGTIATIPIPRPCRLCWTCCDPRPRAAISRFWARCLNWDTPPNSCIGRRGVARRKAASMHSSPCAGRPASWPRKPCARVCRHTPCTFLNTPRKPAASSGKLASRAVPSCSKRRRAAASSGRRLRPANGPAGRCHPVQSVARRRDRAGDGESPGVTMLYFLLYEKLSPLVSGFRVFRYVTSRTAFASLTALFLCIALGPWLIGKLRQFQIGQYIREDGPKSHQKKAGTPTMGGVLIIVSIVIPTLLWADLRNSYVWIAVFTLVAYGAIGFVDDYSKIVKHRTLGLTARRKMLYQVGLAFVMAALLMYMRTFGGYSTVMNVPFLKRFKPTLLISSLLASDWTYALGVLPFFIFVAVVIVGSSNGVNLTDGLDGLAIGLMVVASGALTVLTYAGGHATLAEYLQIARNARTSELTIFCGSMTGASLGFLWYNAHPAEF